MRTERKLEPKSQSAVEDYPIWFADEAYSEVGMVRDDMKEQKRKYFRASEWTESKHWERSKSKETSHVMFAYAIIDHMEACANTPKRKDLLRWFRSTMAETVAHRKDLRRKHAVKSALARDVSELDGIEVDLATAA
jgi:hypothetical protein